MQEIILASQSPRRKTLLEWAQLSCTVIVSDSDEHFPEDLDPAKAPIYIATNKAIAVQSKIKNEFPIHSNKCIVAADTIVLLDGNIIGKPADRAAAIISLQSLSGKSHQVITGVTILYEGKSYSFDETTTVTFHSLTDDQIIYYVDNFKPYDKAGGYAIQEWIGVVGIQSIQGDFYNVMGLPVSKLIQTIKQLGVI